MSSSPGRGSGIGTLRRWTEGPCLTTAHISVTPAHSLRSGTPVIGVDDLKLWRPLEPCHWSRLAYPRVCQEARATRNIGDEKYFSNKLPRTCAAGTMC